MASLHTSSYTPNKATHVFVSDLTSELATAGGYTAGGQALASKTLAVTTAVTILDAADPVWTSATLTAAVAVASDRTPASDATRPLLVYNKSSTDVTSTGGSWTWVLSASGLYRNTSGAEA